MASLQELRSLFNDSDLMEKVEAAVVISAEDVVTTGTPTAADKAWATRVAENPNSEARKALMFVLAANKGAAVATIQGAADTAIQTQVDTVRTILIDALAGV